MMSIKQVVFKRNGILYLTSEENYNKRISNVSDLIKLEGFNSYEEVVDYMWSWKHIARDHILDMTGKEGW